MSPPLALFASFSGLRKKRLHKRQSTEGRPSLPTALLYLQESTPPAFSLSQLTLTAPSRRELRGRPCGASWRFFVKGDVLTVVLTGVNYSFAAALTGVICSFAAAWLFLESGDSRKTRAALCLRAQGLRRGGLTQPSTCARGTRPWTRLGLVWGKFFVASAGIL